MLASTCFSESLMKPLLSLRIFVPYLEKRLASVTPGALKPSHGHSVINDQTGRSYVPDSNRVLLPAQALLAIEQFRLVKSEPVQPTQIYVEPRIEPLRYIQRHNVEQERDPAPVVHRLAYGSLGEVRVATVVEPTVPTITWDQVIGLTLDAYAQNGVGCSEKLYQDSVFWKLYALGVAAVRERPLIVDEDGFTVSHGRTDLEIASRFLLEFKVCPPTSENVRKAQTQVKRYLRTYAEKGQKIERAAVVFFGAFGEMRVIEVKPAGATQRYSPY